MQIITRYDALTAGLARYFSGIACKRGHIAERYAINSGCVICINPRSANRAAKQIQDTARDRAVLKGDVRYSPGIPCKRGHLAERYTSTRGCVECLRPKSTKGRTEAKRRMERFVTILHITDIEYFTDLVHLVSTLREPSLRREDVISKSKPKSLGSYHSQRTFKIFPEDREGLRSALPSKQDSNG
jgi:hypothetical protein